MLEETKAYKEQFDALTNNLGSTVDPHDEFCWKSLLVGWLLAKGVDPVKVRKMAIAIYHNFDDTEEYYAEDDNEE